MTVDITLEGLVDVAEALGLPHPGLVEKDYYVVVALRALSAFFAGNPRLVFGGGTSLCRAHGLIKRMSEDIDLRIVSDNPLGAGGRKSFRKRIGQALVDAGFAFDPGNHELNPVHDGGKTFKFTLPYPQLASSVESLREGVQVEISSWPLHSEPQFCSVTSFWSEGHENGAELPEVPCVTVAETAADKFVALTRRIAWEREAGGERSPSLLRHVYDLYNVRTSLDLADVGPMIRKIMESDRSSRGKGFPAYEADPVAVSRSALCILSEDPVYASDFQIFQRDMVYESPVELATCLPFLFELSELLDAE